MKTLKSTRNPNGSADKKPRTKSAAFRPSRNSAPRHIARPSGNRQSEGQQIPEFAAALVLLVLLFFVPLLDLGIMPVRYFMSQQLIQQYARRLSHCETLTQAYAEMNADPSLRNRLIKLGGVTPKSLEIHLSIATVSTPVKKVDVIKPKTIPRDFLPDGRNSPCEYILEIAANVEVSPAIMMEFEPKVMGLSKPVPFTLRADSPWENLGKNPVTKVFYMNE